MRLPICSDGNCDTAFLPTMSSCTAGLNMRPAMTFVSGRSAMSFGPTPRKLTLAHDEPSLVGRSTTVSVSAEAMAWPEASFFTPGASMIVRPWSRVMTLDRSDAEPARTTMARSVRPVFEIVDNTPIAIASTDSTTATTPAMPITMTNEEPSRCGTLRRFIAEIEVI